MSRHHDHHHHVQNALGGVLGVCVLGGLAIMYWYIVLPLALVVVALFVRG